MSRAFLTPCRQIPVYYLDYDMTTSFRIPSSSTVIDHPVIPSCTGSILTASLNAQYINCSVFAAVAIFRCIAWSVSMIDAWLIAKDFIGFGRGYPRVCLK